MCAPLPLSRRTLHGSAVVASLRHSRAQHGRGLFAASGSVRTPLLLRMAADGGEDSKEVRALACRQLCACSLRACVGMRVCTCASVRACVRAYMHACAHTCMRARIHACVRAYMHAGAHTCMRARMHVCAGGKGRLKRKTTTRTRA